MTEDVGRFSLKNCGNLKAVLNDNLHYEASTIKVHSYTCISTHVLAFVPMYIALGEKATAQRG